LQVNIVTKYRGFKAIEEKRKKKDRRKEIRKKVYPVKLYNIN